MSGYTWPKFEPGHKVNVKHGGYDPARVSVLAAQLTAALLAADSTPDYLRDPSYLPAIEAYCRAQAVCELEWTWLCAQDIEAALADLTSADKDEDRAYSRAGRTERRDTKRRSTARHTASVLNQLHRHEVRAAALRNSLGLAPAWPREARQESDREP